jgi:hypothetical protein
MIDSLNFLKCENTVSLSRMRNHFLDELFVLEIIINFQQIFCNPFSVNFHFFE